MATEAFEPQFVTFVPEALEDGVLYISMEYTTIAHLCACGCGNPVVAPLHPAQWRLWFDGETVTVRPSVGSWQLACRSHYLITRNQVQWARPWSDEEIAQGRRQDQEILDEFFTEFPSASPAVPKPLGSDQVRRPWWRRVPLFWR